ncbi:MAG: hypothetical protein GX363_05185 [Clostridiales bacterium]|nr:hypothetical protein [Clostridiales bacterium]
MVLFPEMALESANKGINLWAEAVLPSLLPFFICANFMISLGVPGLVGRLFENLFQKIFGVPGSSAFVFIISISSGYPMGPKLIGDMGRRGEITDKDAKKMLTFCSTSGPLFMLGTVGVGMFHSPLCGTLIAISHYIGALLNGLLFNLLTTNDKKIAHERKYNRTIRLREESVLELFTNSIISSLKTLGVICCYIIIFVMITDFIELSGLLDSLSSDYQRGFLKGLLEITIGSYELSLSNGIGLRMKCVLATFIISFGGISTLGQSMSVMYGLRISIWDYLKAKLSHGLIAGLVAYVLSPYILNKAVYTVGAFKYSSVDFDLGVLSQLIFSTRMIIIILVIFTISIGLDYILSRKAEQLA